MVNFKDTTLSLSNLLMRGGPIWHILDKNNYYIARANPLENNFRIYYVKNGIRKILDSATVTVSSGKWHNIKILHRGSKIEGYLNEQKLLEVEDDTFSETGGVGVWTKADAVTYFDDLKIMTE